jgi:hypothetical protein
MTWKDPEKRKEYIRDYKRNINKCAISMLMTGVVSDPNIWHRFCNTKRHGAVKYMYFDDFTDEIFFEKMKDGCIYCGDLATTIDRVDSTLCHTPNNCVGCCQPCNFSKGNGDPNSFIQKAYFRVNGKYFVDDAVVDIWSDNNMKPRLDKAKVHAQKQKIPCMLTQKEWNILVTNDCVYCKRQLPKEKWNGVDKIIPSEGYILENVVSCCHDCNNDKGVSSIEETLMRNKRIVDRLDNGDIPTLVCQTFRRTKGMPPNTKKVCAYGKLYLSKREASRKIGKSDNYIVMCIQNDWHPGHIFEVSDGFYDKYIGSETYITKEIFEAYINDTTT